MRCKACNNTLSDMEAVRKDAVGFYMDMCTECVRSGKGYYDDLIQPSLDLEQELPEIFVSPGTRKLDY